MLKDISEALNLADELVIDDCASLYWVFQNPPEKLKKFYEELKLNLNSKEGFYFDTKKYRFYNIPAVQEIVDFMIRHNDKMLLEKIIMNADPRQYITTVCIHYGDEEIPANGNGKK